MRWRKRAAPAGQAAPLAILAATVALATSVGAAPAAARAHSSQAVPAVAAVAMAGYASVSFTGLVGTNYDSSRAGVTVGHPSTGVYAVQFGGLAFPNGGDVQLTTLSEGGECTIAGWSSSLPVTVSVDCYDNSGNPVDLSFNVLVTQPVRKPSGVLDYAWVSNASGPLVGRYDYNSSLQTNSVAHLGTGRYLVRMPGPPVARVNTGTVKVSAYGASAGGCQLAKWTATRTAQLIYVDCFAPTGGPQNRDFTVAYARGNNLMGENGLHDANALANGSAELYEPQVQYDSNRGARIAIVHLDRGIYEMLPVGTHTDGLIGGAGDLQATAIGNSQRICIPFEDLETHLPLILVECLSGHVGLSNTAFTVQWVIR